MLCHSLAQCLCCASNVYTVIDSVFYDVDFAVVVIFKVVSVCHCCYILFYVVSLIIFQKSRDSICLRCLYPIL